MTDNEIIKALECCANSDDCNVCSCLFYLDDDCDGHCREVGMRYALDLINRQKAEIERLEKECEELEYKLGGLLCHATGSRLSKAHIR